MGKAKKIEGTAEAWEQGDLGSDEQYAKVSDEINLDHLDEALELQAISIRMQKSLLKDLKLIAKMNNMGYQPLIKQILQRFVIAEQKKFYREQASMLIKQKSESSSSPDEDDDLEPEANYG